MKKILLATLTAGILSASNFVNLEMTNSTIFINAQFQALPSQPIYVRGGYLINTNKNNFVYAGIKSEGNLFGNNANILASLFVDGVYTKNNSAIPLGIGVSSYLPFYKVPTLIKGEIEYAPKILSFKDADRFLKAKIELGIQFIKNAEAFVGYRTISFNHLYNNAVYVGAGFNF